MYCLLHVHESLLGEVLKAVELSRELTVRLATISVFTDATMFDT